MKWCLTMKKSVASLMDEIRRNLELLESSLPKRVDGWALSQMSKLPFKVLAYREALAWRMAELGRAAFEEFEKNRLAAGVREFSNCFSFRECDTLLVVGGSRP
jgi:hypothetical protein